MTSLTNNLPALAAIVPASDTDTSTARGGLFFVPSKLTYYIGAVYGSDVEYSQASFSPVTLPGFARPVERYTNSTAISAKVTGTTGGYTMALNVLRAAFVARADQLRRLAADYDAVSPKNYQLVFGLLEQARGLDEAAHLLDTYDAQEAQRARGVELQGKVLDLPFKRPAEIRKDIRDKNRNYAADERSREYAAACRRAGIHVPKDH